MINEQVQEQIKPKEEKAQSNFREGMKLNTKSIDEYVAEVLKRENNLENGTFKKEEKKKYSHSYLLVEFYYKNLSVFF